MAPNIKVFTNKILKVEETRSFSLKRDLNNAEKWEAFRVIKNA